MKGYVYILKDEKGRFYVGSTNDVERRLRQHETSHTRTTSKMMKNPRPVLIKEYNSLSEARKIEAKIKKLKRKDYIEKMVGEGNIRISI